MWTENSPPEQSGIEGQNLSPTEVLYYYDGPVLFVTRIGLADMLCHKFDETADADFFILSHINDPVLSALKAGRISVRGALEGERYWVCRSGKNLEIQAIWPVTEFELPLELLPERHVGLWLTRDHVPDTLDQAEGFFSVKYQGPDLRRGSISFRRFKSLVAEVYDLATNYIMPAFEGSLRKGSVLDFDLNQPKLASLLISIRDPVVLTDAINRRKLKVAPAENLVQAMRRQRNDLMEGMSTVVEQARKGDLKASFAGDNITWITALNTVSPSQSNDISVVEISTRTDDGSNFIVLDTVIGDRIKLAHKEIARSRAIIGGTIFEINGRSKSFVFRANGIRQTTCYLSEELFDEYERNGNLRYGARVIVDGEFERRDRRDLILAQQVTFPA